ncbi:peptide chain release factor N(5)-glutamine methyltransferase [Mycoplasmopsis pullorum]|uniref:peptide chain release factor N(5)-glutamine methyltransferase n=1 Tax=Mycoplasmopsis pullorum TaxID=48003 RepID=UPI00111A2C6E|nr:peptide chain release factor N(5)-glutamine methyltransferase [Mycoplasmopsis pullorum]TNK82029.1 peptide chain release factor N(5)-glutamine methyltransferase [Mycoplasmopsis pullorum]TNK83111.1 peptide chain release factor N(5)-glutamine methyltransferase [Mycoplasmopsis pullorum]TNK84318.1 peptide chain release factor N(5)-glutamine methyltransferase [Mycoplasmopsis pullorum]TNK85119.1 peptide chain release factor N(5)-glutamine methyltransferase [Mycoplasmopsis pullorum]TNK85960.1 pepti
MPTVEDLLLEKRRYGLPEKVSEHEKKLLKQDTPVQKIIGYVDLANVRIFLDKYVLIPRYETEELVLKAIEKIPQNAKVLDLGCGSGFIAIALKKNRPDLEVYATDISDDALIQTKQNALINGVKINVMYSNLFSMLRDEVKEKKFDVIISNPPYILESEVLPKSVINHEPFEALFAPDYGLFFYKKILENRKTFLEKNGMIFFEINPIHGQYWEILKSTFNLELFKDINQKDRMVIIQLND